MKQVTYINRYGDEIIFKEISETEIAMYGFDHYRCSDNFIDPSGGPYIAVGMDVGRYFDDSKERRVESFYSDVDGKIILNIK